MTGHQLEHSLHIFNKLYNGIRKVAARLLVDIAVGTAVSKV